MAKTNENLHKNRVVIIGGGVAGLTCAYELQQLGYDCTVLEADPDHIGGRIRTVSFGYHNGTEVTGEVGAMRIPRSHTHTLNYVKKLGLSYREFVGYSADAFNYFRGVKAKKGDLPATGRIFGVDAPRVSAEKLWEKVVSHATQSLSRIDRLDLFSQNPQSDRIRRLDRIPLLEMLEEAGLSDDEIDYLNTRYDLEPLLSSAFTEHLREEISGTWDSGFVELCDGMRRLPHALASQLHRGVFTGCHVKNVTQSTNGDPAAVSFIHNGELGNIYADYVICTVPCPVMGAIEFDPPLDNAKQRAVRTLHYESAHKVLALCRHRFWESDDGIYGGASSTDLATGVTVYPSDNRSRCTTVTSDPASLLASYTIGSAAKALAAQSDEHVESVVKRSMMNLHGRSANDSVYMQFQRWNWDTHPLAGGAFAMFAPGQHTRVHADLVRSHGNVYFAGEHTSLCHSWIEGAVLSSQRVVQAIMHGADMAIGSDKFQAS